MALAIGPSRAGLFAQTELKRSSEALASAFERLSSGLRINHASDDPAGFQLSSDLSSSSRVLGQALRNVNDGISLLSVADAALGELTEILARQEELAQQAGNGVLSYEQRQALNAEANALTDEYNRIVSTTEFNGIGLLDLTNNNISLQVGEAGANGSVAFSTGEELARTVGTGSFSGHATSGGDVQAAAGYGIKFAHLDSDSFIDMVTVDADTGRVHSYLGNGDGTFRAMGSFSAGVTVGTYSVDVADFDNDGNIDFITPNAVHSAQFVALGNGNGTFASARSSYSYLPGGHIVTGDFDADGNCDAILAGGGYGGFSVLLGNGNGTLSLALTIAASGYPTGMSTGDFNGDGHLDFVGAEGSEQKMDVFIGNGDGTFQAKQVYSIGENTGFIYAEDLDNDGATDLIAQGSNHGFVFKGQGDGTFDQTPSSFSLSVTLGYGTPDVWYFGDVNSDGRVDWVQGFESGISVHLGRGDGTFGPAASVMGGTSRSVEAADFNNDGVLDLAYQNRTNGVLGRALGQAVETSTIPYLNLGSTDSASAALITVQAAADRVAAERANIGALTSRFSHTVNYVQVLRENFQAAFSSIMDADVAEEVAKLTKFQILQQAQTAMLAQANQQQAVVLALIGG